jgi:hypothetical protein
MRWRNDTHFVEALYVVFLAFCCALLASCAHDPALQKKIESKSVQLPALAPQARADAAEKTIEAAPLSEEQKSKLEALTLSTTTELQSLREENARLRLLLVRELVNPQSSDREIDAIKTRILETEKESNKRWISAGACPKTDGSTALLPSRPKHRSKAREVTPRLNASAPR